MRKAQKNPGLAWDLLDGAKRIRTADPLHALQVLQERGYGVLETMEYRGQQGWKYTATKPLLSAS